MYFDSIASSTPDYYCYSSSAWSIRCSCSANSLDLSESWINCSIQIWFFGFPGWGNCDLIPGSIGWITTDGSSNLHRCFQRAHFCSWGCFDWGCRLGTEWAWAMTGFQGCWLRGCWCYYRQYHGIQGAAGYWSSGESWAGDLMYFDRWNYFDVNSDFTMPIIFILRGLPSEFAISVVKSYFADYFGWLRYCRCFNLPLDFAQFGLFESYFLLYWWHPATIADSSS